MAAAITGLDVTGSGSKGTKVHALYQTTDAKATVNAANYFNTFAEHMARVGSITIYASDATYMAKVSIASGVVTLAAMDSFA